MRIKVTIEAEVSGEVVRQSREADIPRRASKMYEALLGSSGAEAMASMIAADVMTGALGVLLDPNQEPASISNPGAIGEGRDGGIGEVRRSSGRGRSVEDMLGLGIMQRMERGDQKQQGPGPIGFPGQGRR